MRGTWRIVGLVALVWVVAGGVILWTRAQRPTPERLVAYIDSHSLESRSPADRQEVIRHVADQLNRLTFEQRQKLREIRKDRKMFDEMTPEEQDLFLDLTLPEGFRQMMVALNKMKPEQRKKIVERALENLSRDRPEGVEPVDQKDVQKVISQGMDSFYKDASAEVKLEFAPVIEELQRATQRGR